MLDKSLIDELAEKVVGAIPKGSQTFQENIKNNLRVAVSAALARMDLVTREEFDVQAAVLNRTRAKLDKLEQQLDLLEASQTTNRE